VEKNSNVTKIKSGIVFHKLELSSSFVLGLFISWLAKGRITPLLFSGKDFEDRSFYYQFILIFAFTVVFSIICFLFVYCLEQMYPNKTIQIKHKLERWNNTFRTDSRKRLLLALAEVFIGISIIFIINNVLSNINQVSGQYENHEIIPVMVPIGNDFRIGLYYPAQSLVNSGFKSIGSESVKPVNYPPFNSVLGLPYLLFNESTAYLIHISLLIFANFACLAIASLLVKEYVLSGIGLGNNFPAFIVLSLFFIISIFTFSSYPFAFSLERGNYDIFAMIFSLLALWVLVKNPEKIWLQIILLSVAVHIKIYPVALFMVLLYKHGKKMIIPTIIVNLVFLFILGPNLAFEFIQSVTSAGRGAGIGNQWTWVGNHSAYSFAESISNYYSNLAPHFFLLWFTFILIPIILWGMAFLKVNKNIYSEQNAILLFMVTVPFMDLVPTVSMDYKLVIISPSIIFLFSIIIKNIIQKLNWFDYSILIVLFIVLLLIGRPYSMSENNPYHLREGASLFINNKYFWSLALEGFMVWYIFRNNHVIQIGSQDSDSGI
jgi:hypothetical protein